KLSTKASENWYIWSKFLRRHTLSVLNQGCKNSVFLFYALTKKAARCAAFLSLPYSSLPIHTANISL
ncbi:hypothetical protein, partial [Bartonella sp. AP58NXGY]|uniref:hypothetical protein n=1 Tax=Bartonella sp. AP58NXGY TaxID=3243498 RepID=UPI0035D01C6F